MARSDLDEIESRIRKGEIPFARLILEKLAVPGRTASAASVARFASLQKRTGDVSAALKLVSKRLRGERRSSPATAELWAEYADCMNRFNAVSTAGRVLNDPQVASLPISHLYRGFNHIHKWDYLSATTELRAFLEKSSPDEYGFWVAQVNLAASQAALGQNDQAVQVLDRIQGGLTKRGYLRLLFNCLELRLQICVSRGDPEGGDRVLGEISRLGLQQVGAVDDLVMDKWKAVWQLGHDRGAGIQAIQKLRARCGKSPYPEVARDLDYWYARARDDQKLLAHIWFGTPYGGFRERMKFAPPPKYSLRLPASCASSPVEAAKTISLEELAENLPAFLDRLAQALLIDFYRPPNVVELHERVYPNTFFDPHSSPLNIRQLVHRFRSHRELRRLGLEIDHDPAGYRLTSRHPLSIELSRPCWSTIGESRPASLLKKALASIGPRFTAVQFAREVDMPLRNAQVVLKALCEERLLTKLGRTKGVFYEIPGDVFYIDRV